MEKNLNIIGLTGPTGSGKTQITEIVYSNFSNVFIINADKVAHKVIVENLDCKKNIIETFSNVILNADGSINRKKLGQIVFSNKHKLAKLNKIMFPYITISILNLVANVQKNYKLILLDAPTLIESGLDKICEKVIVVVANRSVRKNRIIERDNLTDLQANSRLNNQLKYNEYLSKADYIIYNNRDIEYLKKQVYNIFSDINKI